MKANVMPSREQVKMAMKAIKRTTDYEFFFGQLRSPEWIQPLKDEGLFEDPPAPIRDGQYIQSPRWPQSEYLKRVASEAPEAVLEIILGTETENARIQGDLIEAVTAMPPHISVKAVAKVQRWLSSNAHLLLPERAAKLIQHLADGGEGKAAVDLTRVLFGVRPDPRASGLGPRPIGVIEDFFYEKLIGETVPVLMEAAGSETVDLLADLLDEAVGMGAAEAEGRDDTSVIWRPAIEDHDQNRHEDVRGFLITALRDASEALLRKQPSMLRGIVEMLDGKRWSVFQRTALHLLRRFGDTDVALVRDRLLNSRLRQDFSAYHEFWLLAGAYLGKVARGDRDEFFADLEAEYREKVSRHEGTQAEGEDIDALAEKAWLARRLTLIEQSLPAEWAERLQQLKGSVSIPEHPDFLVYLMGAQWVGPKSPRTAEELREMPIEEVVRLLRDWVPPAERFAESPEGLGRILGEVVAQDPERFAAQAGGFQGLDPTYVRSLLSGFTTAQREKRPFTWAGVLDLCRWVLDQEVRIDVPQTGFLDRDTGWGWTRKAIADLLGAGLSSGGSEIPGELGRTVWAILAVLVEDPDPTPEHEARYGPPNMDAYTLAINATRPKALEAVILYGLWLHRTAGTSGNGDRSLPPEMRAILDAHLDPQHDLSIAVRSVLGRWFPWLLYLDRTCTTENLPRIFPREESLQVLRNAAWDGYIKYSGIFDDVLEVLTPEYQAAIERSRGLEEGERDEREAARHLAEHLVVYAWRGKLEPRGSVGLLDQLFRRADPWLRAHALAFAGRRVRTEDDREAVPDDVRDRLVALWDWWAETFDIGSPKERSEERRQFGWWFASGTFADTWALPHLIEVLRSGSGVEVDHLVVERLAELVGSHTSDVLTALRLLVQAAAESWGASLWEEPVSMILRTALRSSDSEEASAAENLVHLLGAAGFPTYGALLTEARPPLE